MSMIELNQPIARDDAVSSHFCEALLFDVARLRRVEHRLRHLNAHLLGAASAVLNTYHRYGGWTADEHPQLPKDVLRALEDACLKSVAELERLDAERQSCA